MEGLSLVVSLIISIALCVWGGNISKGKGYSFASGFLWVFFLGLLGLVIVAVEKPKEQPTVTAKNANLEQNTSNSTNDNSPIQ